MKKTIYILAFVLILASCSKNDNSVNPTVTGPTNDQFLTELNLMRSNPSAYADLLAQTRQYYVDTLYEEPGQPVIITHEGVAAVNEAINVLKQTPALPTYTMETGLSKAAMDHVNDIGPKGLFQHSGSDGSSPEQRMLRYGSIKLADAECIAGGQNDARKIIFQFLVDDNVADRGHRAILLNPIYLCVGIGFGWHSKLTYLTVMDFASDYTNK